MLKIILVKTFIQQFFLSDFSFRKYWEKINLKLKHRKNLGKKIKQYLT